MKILYIDDNEDDRYSTSRFFEESGMEIVCVENAEAGLTELTKGGYDLVISDILMPGEDGLEFAKRIKTDIPVILASGELTLGGFKKYQGLRNYLGFILKPVTPEKLNAFLESRKNE